MSATHGLKGNVRKLVHELHALRTNAAAPRDMSMREHLHENYGGLTPGAMFSELGVDPDFTRVVDLMQDDDLKYLVPEAVRQGIQTGMGLSHQQAVEMARRAIVSQGPILSEANGGARYVSPEVWLDPIMSGAVQAAYWNELIMRDIPVASDSVNIPNIKLSDATPEDSEEGATAEEGTVDHSFKKVTIKKRKKALKITDESILFNSLNLLSVFFVDYGRLLGLLLNGDAVNVIVNGDVAGGSEASAVIGVSDPTKGFQYRDFLRVGIRFNQLGRSGLQAISGEEVALDYLDITEVKQKQFAGSPLMAVKFKGGVQTPNDLFASHKVADEQIAIQDSSVSLVKLTAQPLLVETERMVMKGINGTVASTFTGFAKLNRNASIRMDRTLQYDDEGANIFPSWMSPYDE
jgi:hypothetical protein